METRIERHGPPVGFGATAHSHGRIAPTKERHQLRDGCPALGIETRRGLPKPMGRPIEADRLAPLAEPMTEGSFVHRPPARASDEVEHFRAPVRSGGQGYRERRDNADGDGLERRQVLIRKRRMTGLLTGVRAPRDREPLDPSQGFASKADEGPPRASLARKPRFEPIRKERASALTWTATSRATALSKLFLTIAAA